MRINVCLVVYHEKLPLQSLWETGKYTPPIDTCQQKIKKIRVSRYNKSTVKPPFPGAGVVCLCSIALRVTAKTLFFCPLCAVRPSFSSFRYSPGLYGVNPVRGGQFQCIKVFLDGFEFYPCFAVNGVFKWKPLGIAQLHGVSWSIRQLQQRLV